jgi:hypothetical protein
MKSLKTRLKNLVNLVDTTTNRLIAIVIFLLLTYWILKPSLIEGVLTTLFGAILSMLVGIYSEEIKSERKIRELKPAILLELRYVLISLLENFARFYMYYFNFLKIHDFSRLFELIKKRKKDFPNYLMNDLEPCVVIYESYHKKYLENSAKAVLRIITIQELDQKAFERKVRKMKKSKFTEKSSWQAVLNYFHHLLETHKEIKPSIKPIHMALISSILNNLSAFDADFTENIFYIWHEINELNKEIEVLKGLSRTDSRLIRSISQRTERIAIKIDEILEKEGTNL